MVERGSRGDSPLWIVCRSRREPSASACSSVCERSALTKSSARSLGLPVPIERRLAMSRGASDKARNGPTKVRRRLCPRSRTARAGRTERDRENPRCVRSRADVFAESGKVPAHNVRPSWSFSRGGRRCGAVVASRLAGGATNGGCGGVELVWERF